MSNFEVSVRSARPGDVPALVQLFEQLGYTTDEPTLRAQLEHFGHGGAHALVGDAPPRAMAPALPPHALAGLPTVPIHPRLYSPAPSAQLTALVTDRAARRHGVGR